MDEVADKLRRLVVAGEHPPTEHDLSLDDGFTVARRELREALKAFAVFAIDSLDDEARYKAFRAADEMTAFLNHFDPLPNPNG